MLVCPLPGDPQTPILTAAGSEYAEHCRPRAYTCPDRLCLPSFYPSVILLTSPPVMQGVGVG